jgi:excisionase family DNA binding protein
MTSALIPTDAHGVTIITQRLAYSTEQAADMLGICRQEVSKLIHEGELPARRYGRRVLVTHEALVEFLSRLPAA